MTGAIDLQITDVAFGGKGVARLEGKTVFLPYVIDGESVKARLTREHRKFSEAELEEILTESPHRVDPPCPYFARCGGCVYQHISYEYQLDLKWRQVKETLRRLGGVAEPPMRPLIPSPQPYGYRNRITVHARDGMVGYFQRESNKLIDVERCAIAAPEVNAQLADLRAQRPRDGHYTLRQHDGLRVFTQANDHVAASLLDVVTRAFETPMPALIDAYCGAGFFSKHLRDRFSAIIGIDWDAHAIRAAQRDARPHENYIAAEIDLELPRQLATHRGADVIVDPPATGLSEIIRAALLADPPTQLVYVSCNPSTLARDLAALRHKFSLTAITPLDMFPQTSEIEVVAVLQAT